MINFTGVDDELVVLGLDGTFVVITEIRPLLILSEASDTVVVTLCGGLTCVGGVGGVGDAGTVQ